MVEFILYLVANLLNCWDVNCAPLSVNTVSGMAWLHELAYDVVDLASSRKSMSAKLLQ